MGIIICYKMRQNPFIIMALLGAIDVSYSMKLAPDKLQDMYTDPEYANTWRYTDEPRYVDDAQWESDAPAGYTTLQTSSKSEADIPDYWSYDYSGEKHWKWANDPFY